MSPILFFYRLLLVLSPIMSQMSELTWWTHHITGVSQWRQLWHWLSRRLGETGWRPSTSAPLKAVVCPQCVWRWRRPRKEPSITRDSAARLRRGSLWRRAFMTSLCVSAWRRPRRSSLAIRWTRWRHMVHRCDHTVTDWTVTRRI